MPAVPEELESESGSDEEEEEEEEEKADDAGDDEDEEDDFDFEALAEQVVKKVEASRTRRRGIRELALDVGLSGEDLYMRSEGSGAGSAAASSSASSFDTTAPPGISRLSHSDFSGGAADEAAGAAGASRLAAAREVRGAQVRPNDDRAMRRKEAKAVRENRLEKWFGLRRQKLTPELEKELKAIKLRANFDPKRFYKAHDSKELPKYFAIATEVGGGMRGAGLHNNQREVTARSGRSFLDTILSDAKAQEWTWGRAQEVRQRAIAGKHSGHGKTMGKRKGGATHRGVNWKRHKKH